MESSKVRVVLNPTEVEFREKIYPERRPAVLRGFDIGQSRSLWQSADYLTAKAGDTKVVGHFSTVSKLDFISKNFCYRSMTLAELLQKATQERTSRADGTASAPEYCYLRSIGRDPRKETAHIEKDFPGLAADIHIPELFPAERLFSSVFRMGSAGVQLWTHYDVMDNILIQVVGRKRVVLFPPDEANNLYLCGDKSEVLDMASPDHERHPLFSKALRLECELEPGDVLFIPALWFHNVTSLDFGVAVNVFWRHLAPELYDAKDVYGNKDLVPAARALQSFFVAQFHIWLTSDQYGLLVLVPNHPLVNALITSFVFVVVVDLHGAES